MRFLAGVACRLATQSFFYPVLFSSIMFGTSSRVRQHQHESPPAPGTDSCFGVRSLNGSVTWSGESDDGSVPLDADETLAVNTANDGPSNKSDDAGDYTAQTALSPNIVPPSPDDTLHPLSLSHLRHDFPLVETLSEPSSPNSFTSMPSYVASISSVSRTSSPLGSATDFARQVNAGSEDLVLPMLSLPSTSLHMSLRRWDGEVGGIKVFVAGSQEATKSFTGRLGERCELAEMGIEGKIGILRAGRMVAMLFTGSNTEQVCRLYAVCAWLYIKII